MLRFLPALYRVSRCGAALTVPFLEDAPFPAETRDAEIRGRRDLNYSYAFGRVPD